MYVWKHAKVLRQNPNINLRAVGRATTMLQVDRALIVPVVRPGRVPSCPLPFHSLFCLAGARTLAQRRPALGELKREGWREEAGEGERISVKLGSPSGLLSRLAFIQACFLLHLTLLSVLPDSSVFSVYPL